MTDAAFRPEIYREPMSQEKFGIVQKPLTIFERLYNQNWLRKLFVLVVIAGFGLVPALLVKERSYHRVRSQGKVALTNLLSNLTVSTLCADAVETNKTKKRIPAMSRDCFRDAVKLPDVPSFAIADSMSFLIIKPCTKL